MKSRLAFVLAVLLLALAVSPAVALAWSNGPDGADGFGTHDWVMYQALVLAQPSWVVTEAALFATDDPDSKYGEADKPNHLFLPGGSYRGGPDTVTSLYRQAISAYQSNDTTAASTYLGLLSHYYADMCVPFHTMTGYSDSALHLQYELQVNRITNTPDARPDWVIAWGRAGINDVRAKTVDAAMASRATYPTLATQYMLGGFNETSEMVTRVMLSRAVNDLADIIANIPEGSGIPTPMTLTTTISHHYPSIDSRIAVTAKCVDADDLPVEGARVRFAWSYPASSYTVDAFTGPDGIVRSYADPARLTMGRRVNVQASLPVSQATVASTAAKTSWFMPTEPIGYLRTTVSTGYPAPDQAVTASTLVLNAAGRPIVGAPVTYTWKYKTAAFTRTVSTGADGIARYARNVGRATRGYRVKVGASVPGGGLTRTSSATFVPQNAIGSMQSSVDTVAPTWNTRVTASTTCLDPIGRPLAGVPVDFVWRFRSATWRTTAYTNSSGVARTTHDIKKATRGYPVHITSSTPSGSGIKTSMTWFTVR